MVAVATSSARPHRAIALLGIATAILVGAAIAFLLFGPVYTTSGEQCTSGGGCAGLVTTSAPLGWRPILAVPLIGGVLVLVGTIITRWRASAVAISGIGCIGLAGITVLGIASIGLLFLPADAAAAGALALLIRASPR